MATKTDIGTPCPKCQQSPCACEEPEGTGSKGMDGVAKCDKCGKPLVDGKCATDACGTKKPRTDGSSRVERIDYYGDLNRSAETTEALETTASGALMGKAAITCVGVFRYLQADGSIRNEFRPPEEVFRKESLESFELVPLTNLHPKEKVVPSNYKTYAVGSLGEEIEHDAYNVYAELTIQDETAIADVKNGRTGLSCGYSCDVTESGEVSYPIMGWNDDYSQRIEVGSTKYPVPGVWGGIPYDAIQTNIIGNHVALVDVPRGGDSLHLRFDGADTVGVLVPRADGNPAAGSKPNSAQEENRMSKIRLDGATDYEVPEPVAAHIEKLDGTVSQLTSDKAKADADLAAANAALETVKKDAADLAASMPSRVQEAVSARLALVAKADGFKIAVKHEDSDEAIKSAVIVAAMPSVKTDGMDAVKLDAHFEAACALLSAAPARMDSAASQRLDASNGTPAKEDKEDGTNWAAYQAKARDAK